MNKNKMKKLIKKFLNWVKSSDDLQADYYPSALEVVPPPPSKKRIEISQMHSFELKRKKEIQFLEEDSRLIILKSHIYEDLGKIVILKIQKDFLGDHIILFHENGELYARHSHRFLESREYCLEADLSKYKDELEANKKMEVDIEIRKLQLSEKYSIWVSQKNQNKWNSAHNDNPRRWGMCIFNSKEEAQKIIDGILMKQQDWQDRYTLVETGYYEPVWEKC